MSTVATPVVPQRAERGPDGTTRALLAASWLAVRRPPLLVPAGVALALCLLTLPWQDDHAAHVLHGVAILLACALGAACDDPAGEVVAAAPVPRRTRTLARIIAALGVVLPVYVVALALASARAPLLTTGVLVLEAIGYALVAVALGAGLRAWKGLLNPAYPTVVGFLLAALATYALPRGWAMLDPQPWGPPYEAALFRWPALALVAAGVLALALRDPAE